VVCRGCGLSRLRWGRGWWQVDRIIVSNRNIAKVVLRRPERVLGADGAPAMPGWGQKGEGRHGLGSPWISFYRPSVHRRRGIASSQDETLVGKESKVG
jgi:hypothetical protein